MQAHTPAAAVTLAATITAVVAVHASASDHVASVGSAQTAANKAVLMHSAFTAGAVMADAAAL